jgi:hypothetical protein
MIDADCMITAAHVAARTSPGRRVRQGWFDPDPAGSVS